MTENGWFAARPSGTEDIYKIYAESFRGADHLRSILAEAQSIVDAALAAPGAASDECIHVQCRVRSHEHTHASQPSKAIPVAHGR